MTYELGLIRTDRGQFVDKGNMRVNPRHPDFGQVAGDGVRDESLSFAAADTFAVGAGLGVVIGPGRYRLASNVTFSSGVYLEEGALILPDTGVTVTIGGAFSASGTQHFETGAGTILFSTNSTVEEVNILWWGAVADSGTTDNRASIMACVSSLEGRGGVVLIPSGRGDYYGVSAEMQFLANNGYSNLTIRGEGWGSWIKHTESRDDGATVGMFFFQGADRYQLTNLHVRDFRISGYDESDLIQMLTFDNCDGVVVDHIYFDTNGREGIYFNSPQKCKNVWVTNCYGENIGTTYFGGLSALNLNAINAHCHDNTLYNVGQGIEHTGYGLNVSGNNFSTCKVYGMLLMSTWSGWQDSDLVEQNSQRATITDNILDDCSVGILFGDAGGRTVDEVTYSGNLGKVIIANNVFQNVGNCVNAGQDDSNICVIEGNLFDGSKSDQNSCVTLGAGPAVMRGNTFKEGATKWANLIKATINEAHLIADNIVYGQGWTGVAFWIAGTAATVSGNRMFPFGDTLNAAFLRIGTDNGYQSMSCGDSDCTVIKPVCYSGEQRSDWYGYAVPSKFTWKVGDTIENSAPASAGYDRWRCTVAGTAGTLNSGSTTGSITTGTAALTLSATTGLYPGAMITIVGVTGSFTILSLDYTTKIATLSANADATVAAAAVAYKVPTFQTAGLIS